MTKENKLSVRVTTVQNQHHKGKANQFFIHIIEELLNFQKNISLQ